jgi:hypothetical protein
MGEPVYRGQQQALVVVSVLMTVLGGTLTANHFDKSIC